MKVLVLNGPNLDLLGIREKNIYGKNTLQDIALMLNEEAEKLNHELDFVQSNYEGEIIEKIHEARNKYDYIILNPAAFTHYSIAIRDAISGVNIPTIEVHLSNIHTREEFRQKSVIAPVCIGQISGFGGNSYVVALHAIDKMSKS